MENSCYVRQNCVMFGETVLTRDTKENFRIASTILGDSMCFPYHYLVLQLCLSLFC